MRLDEFDRPSFDSQVLARLRDSEDSFVERKESAQTTKIRRTAVAFANSLPSGREGVIFVGVRDSGEPLPPGLFQVKPAEEKARNALGECYPRIPRVTYRSLRVGESEVLAIVIPASPQRPHFSGGAYIRNGASTEEASEEMLSEMIADRTLASRLLRPWKGKEIMVRREEQGYGGVSQWHSVRPAILRDLDPVGLVLDYLGQRVTAEWERVKLQPLTKDTVPEIRTSLA